VVVAFIVFIFMERLGAAHSSAVRSQLAWVWTPHYGGQISTGCLLRVRFLRRNAGNFFCVGSPASYSAELKLSKAFKPAER